MRKTWRWTEAQKRTAHTRRCYVHLRHDNTSGFRGVTRYHNKWVANCADKYLGLFTTSEEAAMAYDHAAVRKFGQFAHLNASSIGLNNFAVSTGKLENKKNRKQNERNKD